MVRETVDVLVARTPEEVFDRAVDVGRLPEWNGPIESAELVDGPPISAGSTVAVRARTPLGVPWTVEADVTEFDRPTRACFETRTGIAVSACLDVKPVAGGAKVIETLSAEAGPVSGLVVGNLVRWFARSQAENLERLKAQLEVEGSG